MEIVNECSIKFNYRNSQSHPVKMKLSKEVIENLENEWRRKIIKNHENTLIPSSLIAEVIVSNDGEKIVRQPFYLK